MLDLTTYHRQQDLFVPNKTPVTLIGAGGIGSVTAMILAKIGMESITVYDFDTVEDHNIPSQFFAPDQIGEAKVNALASTILRYTGVGINAVASRWDGHVSPVVITAVDSMKTRAEIWDSVKTRFGISLFIDARMGAEFIRIFSFDPSVDSYRAEYEKSLYSDDQATEEPCTAKAIAYNTFVIGGLIGSIVKHSLKGEPYKKEIMFDLKTYGWL